MKTTAKLRSPHQKVAGRAGKPDRRTKVTGEAYWNRRAGEETYPRGHGSLEELERKLAAI